MKPGAESTFRQSCPKIAVSYQPIGIKNPEHLRQDIGRAAQAEAGAASSHPDLKELNTVVVELLRQPFFLLGVYAVQYTNPAQLFRSLEDDHLDSGLSGGKTRRVVSQVYQDSVECGRLHATAGDRSFKFVDDFDPNRFAVPYQQAVLPAL